MIVSLIPYKVRVWSRSLNPIDSIGQLLSITIGRNLTLEGIDSFFVTTPPYGVSSHTTIHLRPCVTNSNILLFAHGPQSCESLDSAWDRHTITTVSGVSFVSMGGAWQENSFFLIGYFKRLSHIIGRTACLILNNNPCQTGRTNETYA